MNPYSCQAVEGRRVRHFESVERRNRLAVEAERNPSWATEHALENAELEVRAGLARMEAMGDPLPAETASATEIKTSAMPSALAPPPVGPLPAAGTNTPDPEVDPVDAIAARIMSA